MKTFLSVTAAVTVNKHRTLYKKSLSGTFYRPAFTRHVVSNLTLYWINKTV